MKKISFLIFIIFFQLSLSSAVLLKDKNSKKKSDYEKLFDGKKYQTAAGGFITIHKIGAKLYFELPLKMMDRELLLTSAITQSSDNNTCINGYKADPLHFRFAKNDSLVYLRKINTSFIPQEDFDSRMKGLIDQNFSDPFLEKFKIVAYNKDSSAVVFETTNLMLNTSEPYLAPISRGNEHVEITPSFNKRLSTVRSIKSFDDNISVVCQFGGRYSTQVNNVNTVKDALFTILSTRSILLLPEVKMRPRKSDLRLGTFLTSKQEIPSDGNVFERCSFANRWNLVPSDIDAYRQKKLTTPVKPIVFYIDSLFPESWLDAIRKGTLRWNKAFEKIGFADAIQVRDFPKNNPDFDADNLKYSCIRYVASGVENAQGPSWVDPTTGEIINATVFIHSNVVKLVSDWLFVQTAQVDERVRTKEIPDSLLMDAMEYVVAHEVGHCLGLMHNMAASSAFPVDSLRSVSFTRRYGTTPSIMDYARFNYIAQPADKGVKLTPPYLGVYDYFAIKWLYSYFPDAQSFRDEAPILESWVDEKAGNPFYRYGRQQLASRYDPSSIEEDLGDDPVKAGTYGIDNLKYILSHLDEWIKDDPYAERKAALYNRINRQYYRYLRNVMYNIGGIYLRDVKDGLSGDNFQSVSKERQQASVKWVINELKHSRWLHDKNLMSKLPVDSYQTPFITTDICKHFNDLSRNITLSAHISDDPYTLQDYYNDLYAELWDNVAGKETLSEPVRILQTQMLRYMNSGLALSGGEKFSITDSNINGYLQDNYHPSLNDYLLYNLDNSGLIEQYSGLINRLRIKEDEVVGFGSGYAWQQPIDVSVIDDSSTYYIDMVMKIKNMLESRMSIIPPEEKKHYEAMLFGMNQMLGKSNLK